MSLTTLCDFLTNLSAEFVFALGVLAVKKIYDRRNRARKAAFREGRSSDR